MQHVASALAGRYRIDRELGVGGMATVYLAQDVRHDRRVAIKVLRPELAATVGTDRFLEEIRTIAQLQHPYILGLIDSGELDGTAFYVMPFVEGESLRELLMREKQLPVPQAVRIIAGLAGALDYAHRRGVIHRDIKPANILLHDGTPFLADFGIALAATRARAGERLTESGMSLGTPEYMSPEQVVGDRTLDGRADIWALGCVLYEMLCGEPPFTGPTTQAVVSKVMTAEPVAVTTLRRAVPANVAAACLTALSKVPADRFASCEAFVAALHDPAYTTPAVAAEYAARRSRGTVVARWPVVTAAAVALLATGALASAWLRPNAAAQTGLVARFDVQIPDSTFSPQVVLSRDGSRIVWANQSGFFERPLDSLSIRRVRDGVSGFGQLRDVGPSGTEALLSGRGGLAIVSLTGGPPRSLVANGARGGSWSSDGYVYFGLPDQSGDGPARVIARVRAEGGAVDTLLATSAPVTDIVALPDGGGLIIVLEEKGELHLNAFDIRARKLIPLGVSGASPQYMQPGYLLYVDGTDVMAGPFDESTLAFVKPPRVLESTTSAGTNLLLARGGLYVHMHASDQVGSGVVIAGRSGTGRPLPNIPDTIRFTGFALSPDGARLVASGSAPPTGGGRQSGPPLSNLYIYELGSERLSRLRSDLRDASPSWMTGGKEVSFVRVSADTPTTSTLMRRPWDGSAFPTSIMVREGGRRGPVLGPVAWLPDGRHGIIRIGTGGGRGTPTGDLFRIAVDNAATLDTVAATEYAEQSPAVSADGTLLAFTSDQSGRGEVYVRALAGGTLHRVSLGGGAQPRWGRAGKSLYYTNADTLFTVDVRPGAELHIGDANVVLISRSLGQGFAVMPGDSTFVMAANPRARHLEIVLNIAAELERMFKMR